MGTDNTQFHRRFWVWKRKASERSSTFSLRFTVTATRFPSGQDLKSEYLSRATRGHQNQEFSLKFGAEVREGRGLGSSGLQKVSSSLQEVGNLSTQVYFLFKYCFGLS